LPHSNDFGEQHEPRQIRGGITQGVGQAWLEQSHYDPETGQLLAASSIDYAMPRADTFPTLKTALSEMPSPTNRRRPAPAAKVAPAGARRGHHAIVDALSEFGGAPH
jgi:carbon-monoxide dehydrogenase large subunit